jgi:hypothetical protein
VVFETISGCAGVPNSGFQAKIVDEQSWRALWDNFCTGIFPPRPVPTIDFSKEMVIALFLGTRSNSCYGVEIRTIEDSGGKYLVNAVEKVPVGCLLPAVTYPHHLVKTERRDVPVEFLITQEVFQPGR